MEVPLNQTSNSNPPSPASSVSSLQPEKKKKKKRNMFHRRNARKSKEASAALWESDPLHGRRLLAEDASMDEDSKWVSENNIYGGSPDSMLERRSLADSDIPSRTTHLQIGEHKMSRDELGDVLVNPSSVWPPPPSVIHELCVF